MDFCFNLFYKRCKKIINMLFETFTCRIPPEYQKMPIQTQEESILF